MVLAIRMRDDLAVGCSGSEEERRDLLCSQGTVFCNRLKDEIVSVRKGKREMVFRRGHNHLPARLFVGQPAPHQAAVPLVCLVSVPYRWKEPERGLYVPLR